VGGPVVTGRQRDRQEPDSDGSSEAGLAGPAGPRQPVTTYAVVDRNPVDRVGEESRCE